MNITTYLLLSNSYELAAAHWSLTDAYVVVHELTPQHTPTHNEHAAGRSSSSQLSDVAPLQACGGADDWLREHPRPTFRAEVGYMAALPSSDWPLPQMSLVTD